ncbi:hypothetical protein MTR67_043911 [Solanum verrucosum]|uniref:Uncharacterized protein n=1 Tax=Solanum verrucosum TaxID=315347 RepID=A0AAF0USB3_SOLVR|nr:hypothetical protein MTR67_043911 [Solanum verrucosum]
MLGSTLLSPVLVASHPLIDVEDWTNNVFARFSKHEFWLRSVAVLGHIVSEKRLARLGVRLVDSTKGSVIVTPQTRGAQLAPNAKAQAQANPAEPFATSAWQPHAIKKSNKYISA